MPFLYYLTTRIDGGLSRALQRAGKEPQIQFSEWPRRRGLDFGRMEPAVASPVVYHLHGHVAEPDSVVLTVQEEFDFVGASAADPDVISLPVRASLASSTVLALDFDPAGTEFQSVLALLSRLKGTRRIVYLVPSLPGDVQEEAMKERYRDFLDRNGIRLFWGNVADFTEELSSRWEKALDAGT
jgi:hypothetical protein